MAAIKLYINNVNKENRMHGVRLKESEMSKKKEETKQDKEPLKENEEVTAGKTAEKAAEKEPTELEKATALAEDYKRKWYAVSAEYDNYRKRNQAAVSKAYADGAAEAVLKLLPVADNFGYALDGATDEKTRTGIDKVIKSFNTILSSIGVEEIPVSAGDDFDESVMEAVLNFPIADGEKPNKVKQVLKKGYKGKDGKVIRYAQVAVTV